MASKVVPPSTVGGEAADTAAAFMKVAWRMQLPWVGAKGWFIGEKEKKR